MISLHSVLSLNRGAKLLLVFLFMIVFMYELAHFYHKRLLGPFGSSVCLLFCLKYLSWPKFKACPWASPSGMCPVFAGRNSRCLVFSQIFSPRVELAPRMPLILSLKKLLFTASVLLWITYCKSLGNGWSMNMFQAFWKEIYSVRIEWWSHFYFPCKTFFSHGLSANLQRKDDKYKWSHGYFSALKCLFFFFLSKDLQLETLTI